MVDHIWKISGPGVFDKRSLSWNIAIIVFIKNTAWIEDYIKVVTEFPCLLGHPVHISCIIDQAKILSVPL